MAAQRPRHSDERPGTRVLPLRREGAKVPSPVLVREALQAFGLSADAIRGGVAIAAAVGEGGLAIGADAYDERALSAELARRTGMTSIEVGGALRTLREAKLLGGAGAEALDPDLLCALPVLSGLVWERCREEIEDSGGRVAPALAVLRVVARMSRPGKRDGGDWVQASVQDLAEETMYGRTAVTHALADLEAAGLLVRAAQPPRRGVRVRVSGWALGSDRPLPARTSVAGSHRRRESPYVGGSPAGEGVVVEVGGARVTVPPGSRLQLAPGVDYRLEIGPDGAPMIRVDD